MIAAAPSRILTASVCAFPFRQLPISSSFPVSRPSRKVHWVVGLLAMSISSATSDSRDAAVVLMQEVYGDWKGAGAAPKWLPKPLPKGEAGAVTLQGFPEPQSRYLWVDAWGVLNFVSLARDCVNESEDRKDLLAAARSLIRSVHAVLGVPCTPKVPMAERQGAALAGAESTLSRYRGLRIGKVECSVETDMGMSRDGMYWHYVDKWVYALARFAREAGDITILRDAVQLLKDVHPSFFVSGDGVHWKLNVDLRPIRGYELDVAPNSDVATAWVVYDVLRQAAEALGDQSCVQEVEAMLAELSAVGAVFFDHAGGRVTRDPLGYGLAAWKLQWVGDRGDAQREGVRRALQAALQVDAEAMALPFRLYGALLGGRVVASDTRYGARSCQEAAAALATVVQQLAEAEARSRCDGATEHSGINKVMLASVLAPAAFLRLPAEDLL